MQHIFSIIAAASALTMPQTGIATNAPVAVSTCTVSDLYNPSSLAEFGPPIPYRMLQLTFLNTDDAVATQVTFDVTHDGAHAIVVDRGRFSKGVPIEHLFDDFTGTYGAGPAACAIAAITFADGRRWSASGGGATTAATLR
jgi:hypothetical protein